MISTRHNASPLKPWHVVLAVCLGYVLVTLAANGGDPMAFVALGNYCDATLPGAPQAEPVEGYDGQFVYMIARDPANAHRVIDRCDNAAYRYQRILYPMLARLLALGQEALLPWSLLLINLAAVPAGAYILERLLAGMAISRWYALSYGLFGGLLIALRLDLNEPLAYALALAGVWAWGSAGQPRGVWLSALCFALAGLAKETTFFFAGGCLLYLVAARRWRDAGVLGAISIGPFLAWQGYLRAALGAFGLGSGGAKATPFEWFPYNGVWRILTDAEVRAGLAKDQSVLPVLLVLMALALLVAALPSAWALWRSGRELWAWLRGSAEPAPHLYVFLLFANALVMPFVPFSTYREPLGIMRFAVGLLITVVLYAAARRARRPLNYSLFWALTAVFALSYALA